MTQLTGTNVYARLLRLLVVVGCLLPFPGPRTFTASTLVPLPAPSGPINEEDETGREEAAVHRAADSRLERRSGPIPSAARLATAHGRLALTRPLIPHPAPDDPFRNGLGSPYRC